MKLPKLRQKGKAFYFDAGGKPRKWVALGSNLPQAIAAYHRLNVPKEAGGTVGRMLDAHMTKLRERAELKPATLALYSAWQMHLHRVFGHLAPADITQADVLQYLDACPRTSGPGEISLLSGAYRSAMRAGGRVTFNPCVGAKSERPRSKRSRNLSHAEIGLIYAQAPALLRVAMDLGYMTGLRESELCALRWDDFGAGEAVERGKGGPLARFTLTDDLRAILDDARALQGRIAGFYVLCERGRQVNRHRIKYLWDRACLAAGVQDAVFHDMRARAGTDADAAGQDATKLLGHADARTTKTYLRGKRIVNVEPLQRRAR